MLSGRKQIQNTIKKQELEIDIMKKLIKLKLTPKRLEYTFRIFYYRAHNTMLKTLLKVI